MEFKDTELSGVFTITPKVMGDSRGWFTETFREDELEKKIGHKIYFVQDNHSFSKSAGVLRGLHFQNFPHSQTKLLRCTRGAILDIVVDLRSWSPTYKKWVAIELSAENGRQIFIPKGFAHGFLTSAPDTEIQYKVDDYYDKESDRSVRFNDPTLGVKWGNIDGIVVSDKDKNAPLLAESDINFGAKVLVTGAGGQLGFDVMKYLREKGIECVGPNHHDLDITNASSTVKHIKKYAPTVIVHCAAYTAVDRAEDEREACERVNIDGTRIIADAANAVGAKLVYISSDYVYGASGQKPLKETDPTQPLNFYAETKLRGEKCAENVKKHYILRTSWVFGKNGNNFVKTMRTIGAKEAEVRVVDDQVGSPTYTVDLAEYIVKIIFTENYGVFNVSNDGYCSWADFAEEIFKQSNMKTKVKRIKTAEYPTKAKRQTNSRLDKSKLGIKLPDWHDALKRYLEDIK
jgi:dTDP-4-dehydrorhamnose reductase/dTDP-4-dehydrorhamnose 3,5-epimerase